MSNANVCYGHESLPCTVFEPDVSSELDLYKATKSNHRA
jgi:hypothetical protein